MSSTRARQARRAWHVCGGAAAAAMACAVIAAGALGPSALVKPSLAPALLLAGITVLTCAAIARRMRFQPPSARSQRVSFWLSLAPAMADIEVAFALIGASYAVIAVSGALDSPLYPLLYGVIAFSVTFQSRPGAWACLGATLILELAFFLRQPFGMDSVVPMLLHLGFIAGAASAHALFLRGMVARHYWRGKRRLRREIEAQRRSARDYRLISAALGAESRPQRSRAEEEHMLAAGGIQTINASVYYTLSLLQRLLPARTCVLLWLDPRGEALAIKEVITAAPDGEDISIEAVTGASAIPLQGVLGAVVHDRAPLLIPRTKPGQVPYCGSRPEGSFAGVPVMAGAHLRGIVCAHRDDPFGDRELAVMTGATEQILRCVQSEQLLLAVERAKYEHERFYHASAMLCQALTVEEVMETAFDAARQIVDYDVAAISIYDPERRRHQVKSVRIAPGGDGLVAHDELADLKFRDDTGLVSMVVKNKHYLPSGGEMRDVTTPVYGRKVKLKGAESLLVLPLLSGETAVGTFMLAARRRHRFGKDVREMLGVIASQVAVSIQNGLMYEQMKTMATTDGLTGLTNHRTFQERFAELLDRAERHGRQAAMLLCDVDHFKKVNDTYGHPVGDQVLRQVARVVRSAVRKVDIPARYGGEEFAVVLEETGLDGAMRLAERIRSDVGAMVIESDKGSFQVTMSIGIATFPDDGSNRATLIEHADQALYNAKESGRNRCVSYRRHLAEKPVRQAS